MNTPPETNSYDAMALAVKASIEELLIPFHVASDSPELLRSMSTDEFFCNFLIYADKFTGQCCQELSKIFRKVSALPEIRGTPTLELAKQIRQSVFESPDAILVSYVDALRQINLDLRETTGKLSDSSVLAEALKGAAIGRVAGGFGEGGKVLSAVGAIAAAGKEATQKLALLEQHQRLIGESRNLAFSKIIEYLKAVEGLAENLLDYGCAKCFGGQIDFSRQALAVNQVRDALQAKMAQSLELILKLQQIKREEMERVQQAAVEEQQKSERAFNLGCGGVLTAVGVLFLLGMIGALMEGEEGAAMGCVGIGVVLIAVGLLSMQKKQP